MNIVEDYIMGLLIPILLIGSGIFFLFYLKLFFVKHPVRVFSVLFKKRSGEGVSSFGALTVALAGTLGVGNIVGVAGALIMGGAGSVFWMIVSAFAAMVLKYAEILLAHKHRRREGGRIIGGAMFYIEEYFGGRIGRAFGCIFAFFCLLNSLSMGCMLQSNAVSSSFYQMSGVPYALIGTVLALICGVVIFCGVHDISPLTSLIIPLMTILYVGISVIVIFRFRASLPNVMNLIVKDAFFPKSIGGGIFGFFISRGLRYGTMRGLLSNEAGCGTAPMAHSASVNESAAEQGVWGIIEVFVDTVLLCSLTALSVLCVFGEEINAFCIGDEMKLVIKAYGAAIGSSSGILMSVMVFFFAFATIICWAYYGEITLSYLTSNKKTAAVYKMLYVACIFVGALRTGGIVWWLSDVSMASMTLINITVLLLKRKEIKNETEIFIKKSASRK